MSRRTVAVWLTVWAASAVADTATTIHVLNQGGYEANPVAAGIASATSTGVMLAAAIVACALLAMAPLAPWPRHSYKVAAACVAVAALAVKVAVVASNLYQTTT